MDAEDLAMTVSVVTRDSHRTFDNLVAIVSRLVFFVDDCLFADLDQRPVLACFRYVGFLDKEPASLIAGRWRQHLRVLAEHVFG